MSYVGEHIAYIYISDFIKKRHVIKEKFHIGGYSKIFSLIGATNWIHKEARKKLRPVIEGEHSSYPDFVVWFRRYRCRKCGWKSTEYPFPPKCPTCNKRKYLEGDYNVEIYEVKTYFKHWKGPALTPNQRAAVKVAKQCGIPFYLVNIDMSKLSVSPIKVDIKIKKLV